MQSWKEGACCCWVESPRAVTQTRCLVVVFRDSVSVLATSVAKSGVLGSPTSIVDQFPWTSFFFSQLYDSLSFKIHFHISWGLYPLVLFQNFSDHPYFLRFISSCEF